MEYIFFPLISLLAFFVKGLMGVGTSTVTIGLATFLIDPKSAVVLAAITNIFGGLGMLKVDPVKLNWRFWAPITIAMALGGVAGAWTLKFIDSRIFEVILGCAFLGMAGWFVFGKVPNKDRSKPPVKADFMDNAVGGFAGFLGGFIGLNAAPMLLHFGRKLNKQYLRRLFVIVYLATAITQTATFAVNGLLTKQIMLYGLIMLPFMFAGIYLGNHAFKNVSEKSFQIILSVFLVFISLRLIF